MRAVGCLLVLVLGIAFAQALTRQQFVSVFTQRQFGFTCERNPLSSGKERTLCESPNELTMLEMIGDPRRLESAGLLTVVPGRNSRSSAFNLSVRYSFEFLEAAFPGWRAGGDWIQTSFLMALMMGETSRTVHNGYELLAAPVPTVAGAIVISITPR